jgi:hypothetical protein
MNFNTFINEGKFDGIADLVKSLHFEMDPKTAEEKKIELGRKQGEVSKRKQIESGNYSLRRFRKSINYGDGKDVGAFLPGSYDASVSKLGDGPHKKAVKAVKWNQKKYDQWLEDMAANGGAENAFDMAQNAKNETGLIDWVKKEFRGDDPLQRIQWDIEGYAESVVNEDSKDRMIKQIERALKDGDSIFKLPMATQKYYNKNKSDFESVVTEAKYTKKSLLKAMTQGDGDITTTDGKEYVVYKYAYNRRLNNTIWQDDVVMALDQDGEEWEIKYSDIASYNESVVTEAKDAKKDTKKIIKLINQNLKSGADKQDAIMDVLLDGGYFDETSDEYMAYVASIDSELVESTNETESVVNEAEQYITDKFKVGDKIKTNFGEWEVIETDYAPKKSFTAPFIFKGKNIERVNIPNPPKTNKNAVGYKVTDGAKYPTIGFLYQYKDITKLATVGVDESIIESVVTEAKAYKLKASEFGSNTFSAAYNVKGETTWRVHSTYAIDQVSGENDASERDVVFFEAMPINNDIYIKIGGINNLKRTGSTVGDNFGTTIEEWKKDPKGIAKEASEFLTDATHLKWINKKARSQGQTIKWALKDDYSSVIVDLVNKSLGLSESAVTEAKLSAIHKAAKQGSYPAVIVVIQDGKVIHQEPVSTPQVAPATFNVMQEKYPKALLHLEDKTGKRLFSESVVTEKREDVGKYNTVKKAIKAIKKEYGPTPTEQSVASFINDNYYDVTEVERGDDDPQANDKIADLVAFYKFDIDDWGIAWADAQNESVVNEGRSINKIQKEYSKTVNDMAEVVVKWKAAKESGDAKAEANFLVKLKDLTSKKKSLTSELDDAVGIKDLNIELAESIVNEGKIKYAKGTSYQSSGHWTVYVDSNSSGFDIRVNQSAGWRLDPHDEKEETLELLDNGRQRATIYFKSGNIDKFAQQMFDLNDRTTNGNQTKLTAKDYADIIRVWIDMKKANESKTNEAYNIDDIYDLIARHRFDKDFKKLSSKDKEWVENDAKERGLTESFTNLEFEMIYTSLLEKFKENINNVKMNHVSLFESFVTKLENQSSLNEASYGGNEVYEIATPAPKSMLKDELEELFGDDYRNIVTEFTSPEGFESVLMFNITKNDIAKIEKTIGDVLVWKLQLGGRKTII